MTASYETIMVLSAKLDEDATKALVEKFTDLIASHGKVDSIDEWGKRKLAYEIKKEADGYYVLVNFTSKPEFPEELTRVYNITDGVLTHKTFRKEA